MRTCPYCGCSEIDEDAARGDATCTGCGTVLEESIVVTENQFQERAGGSGHTLVGQFVSSERAASNNFNGMGTTESREVTYGKGRKVIEEISSQLRINQHCMDTAFNFFKMCVARNLTRGRTRVTVCASCLYMTCRLENTAHLLLDFSDVTQVNVFELGRNLSFLARSLRINLPSTDPCLYIIRFACMLELGDKQKDVVNLATRLVQRMKRDWMSTGRRPTGLCGAALLIAARSLNFNRTISDVVKVVHISESVVRKRLDEFCQTPSGNLTIDEFSTVDLEHDEDPPAFREARKRAREDQLRKESEQADMMEKDLQPMEEEVEKALEKKRREKFRTTAYAKLVTGTIEGVGRPENNLVRDEILSTVYQAAADECQPSSSSASQHYEMYRPTLDSLGIRRKEEKPTTSEMLLNDPGRQTIAILDTFGAPRKELKDGELDLDDISDSEIDTYILTKNEAKIKEEYWMKANGEIMNVLEQRKREREELDAREGAGASKRRKRHPKKSTKDGSTSVLDAMEKVINEKKLSNKVNYDILKEIETTGLVPKKDKAKGPSASQIVKEVNDLVNSANLASTILEGPSLAFASGRTVFPQSKSELTKNEKTLSRKNIKVASQTSVQIDALRTAFDLKKEVPSSATSSPVKPKKAPLRYGKARPNLSIGGVKKEPKVGEKEEVEKEQKPQTKNDADPRESNGTEEAEVGNEESLINGDSSSEKVGDEMENSKNEAETSGDGKNLVAFKEAKEEAKKETTKMVEEPAVEETAASSSTVVDDKEDPPEEKPVPAVKSRYARAKPVVRPGGAVKKTTKPAEKNDTKTVSDKKEETKNEEPAAKKQKTDVPQTRLRRSSRL